MKAFIRAKKSSGIFFVYKVLKKISFFMYIYFSIIFMFVIDFETE